MIHMRKVSSTRMLALICLFYIGASIAHPFTPTLFTNLGMPDYMFGLAYACMSVMGFIMGPFWGKVSDLSGKVPVMVIGCAGYAVGQLLFSVSTTIVTILLARMFSGIFCNATIICALAYIADNASSHERSSLLAWQAALIAVFGAFGYLLGGVLGDISIPMAFHIQSGIMFTDGLLIALLLRDGSARREAASIRDVLRESNPFTVFAQFPEVLREVSEKDSAQNASRGSGHSGRMSGPARALLFLFITAAFAALATTCFDSSFNYYIKAEFDFPSTYNGIIKAAVGIIGFLADATICMHLIRRKHPDRILALIYAGCAVFIALALMARTIPAFLTVCIVYYTLNSLYLPIQQSLVMRGASERNSGTVSGLFNSTRFIGNVTGSLSAGFLYTAGSTIPFTVAGIIFLGTAIAGAAAARKE